MQKPRVLVTGVGAIIGYGIIKAIKMANLPVVVIGADADKDAVGYCFADEKVVIPKAIDSNYLDFFNNYITNYSIDLVIPGVDHDLNRMIQDRQIFQQSGFLTILPDERVFKLTGDKWNAHHFFKSQGLPTIPTFLFNENEDFILNNLRFPMIAKPRSSSGGKGLVEIKHINDLRYYKTKFDCQTYIIQEQVGSEDMEFTCGSYQTKHSRLLGPIVLKRKLSYGSTIKGTSVLIPEITRGVNDVLKALGGGPGPYCTQIRLTESGPLVLEINPRFSSSTSIKALLGFNEPEMLIRDIIFNEVIEEPNILLNKTICRYFADQILP